MLRLTRTAIGLLTAQYRSVLRKCWAINVGVFGLMGKAAASVAKGAADTIGGTLNGYGINVMAYMLNLLDGLLNIKSNAFDEQSAKAPATELPFGAPTVAGTLTAFGVNVTDSILLNLQNKNLVKLKALPNALVAKGAELRSEILAFARMTGDDSFGLTKALPAAVVAATVVATTLTVMPTEAMAEDAMTQAEILSLLQTGGYHTTWVSSDASGVSSYTFSGTPLPIGSNISNIISSDGKVTGALRINTDGSTTVNDATKYYIFTYTKPSSYSVVSTRQESMSADVSSKVFDSALANGTQSYYGGALQAFVGGNETYNIRADFTYNRISGAYGFAYGGAIGRSGGVVDNITGDFIRNYIYGSSYLTNAYGGAIYNSAITNNITGDFIRNYVSVSGSSSYSSSNRASGGAIYNSGSSTIGNITGDFIGNFVSGNNAMAYGGAISNVGTISSLTGDFIGNYVSAGGSRAYAYGGAIYNTGTISSLTGDFIDNSASSNGGAIYNYGTISSLTGDFIGNSSGSYGGAIYNDGTSSSITFTGNSTFTNNMASSSTPNDIYLNSGTINIGSASNTANVTLNSGYNGKDSSNAKLVIASGSTLKINENNGVVRNSNLGAVTNNGTFKLGIDLDSGTTADTFTIADGSSGNIIIDAVKNLVTPTNGQTWTILQGTTSGVTLISNLAPTTSTSYTAYVNDAVNATTAWTDTYYKRRNKTTTTTAGYEVVDNTQLKYTAASSSAVADTPVSLGDTLAYVNQTASDSTKNFSTTDENKTYNLDADLGATQGNLTITGANSEGSKINLNSHTGFELSVANSSLTLDTVALYGAGSSHTVNLSNESAVLNVINAYIGGTDYNVAGGYGIIGDAGTVNFSGTNNIYVPITFSGTKNIASGITTVAGGLYNATGVLNIADGAKLKLEEDDDTIHTANLGKVTTNNGTLAIDIDMQHSDQTADNFTLDGASTGSIIIETINELGERPTANGTYRYQVLNGGNGVNLALASGIADDWYTSSFSSIITPTESVTAQTTWDKKFTATKTTTTEEKELTTDDGDLVYTTLKTTTTDEQAKVADSLAYVNQTDEESVSDREFSTDNAGEVYTSAETPGETKGNMTISGVWDTENDIRSTLDLNGNKGFVLNDADTSLSLQNVQIKGGDEYTAQLNNNGTKLNLENVVIDDAGITGTNGTINFKGSNAINAPITLSGTSNILNGTTVLNGSVDNQTINLGENGGTESGTIKFGPNGLLGANSTIVNNVANSVLDTQNGKIDETTIASLTLNGKMKLNIDASLSGEGSADRIISDAVTASENSLVVDKINVMNTTYSDSGKTAAIELTQNDILKNAYTLGDDIMDNITGNNYFTKVELENGQLKFSDKLINQSALSLQLGKITLDDNIRKMWTDDSSKTEIALGDDAGQTTVGQAFTTISNYLNNNYYQKSEKSGILGGFEAGKIGNENDDNFSKLVANENFASVENKAA